MPQLDFTFYISQAFWFFTSFSFVYIYFKFFANSKVNEIKNAKKSSTVNILQKISELEISIKNIKEQIINTKKKTEEGISILSARKNLQNLEMKALINNKISSLYSDSFDKIKSEVNDYSDVLQESLSKITKILSEKISNQDRPKNKLVSIDNSEFDEKIRIS